MYPKFVVGDDILGVPHISANPINLQNQMVGRWLAAADKHRFCVCEYPHITIGNIGGRMISSPTKWLGIVVVGRWLAAAVKLSTHPRKIHHVSAIFAY